MERLREKFATTENHEERRCTNVNWIYAMIIFIITLFVLVTYSGISSDVRRLTNGFDDCGYICGVDNEQQNGGENGICEQSNKMKFTKLLINEFDQKCVVECPSEYDELMNFCLPRKNDAYEIDFEFTLMINDLLDALPTIGLICFTAVIFSYILLLLFRHYAHFAVWSITILSLILMGGITSWCWYNFAIDPQGQDWLFISLVFSFLTLVSVIVVICIRERIKLVIQLFKETSKALMDIPALLGQPIATFIATVLAIAPFIGFQILIESSGSMIKDQSGKVILQQNFVIQVARVLNIVAFLWFTQFLIGCQHFIIAGTVSKWYFTRNKEKLGAPMLKTYSNLFWFHLGSVCLGSWVITIIKTIRMILNVMYWSTATSKNILVRLIAFFINWLIAQLDMFFRYIIRNAYIIVAKDGLPFFKAASKSKDLIFNNLIDVLALNHVGDLVLTLGRFFVVAIAGFVGYEGLSGMGDRMFLPLFIAVILSFIIVHCLVTVFEMTVDTIFLCYCEDVEANDGSALKPYYMSSGLQNVMEELKEYGQKTKGAVTTIKEDETPIITNEAPMATA